MKTIIFLMLFLSIFTSCEEQGITVEPKPTVHLELVTSKDFYGRMIITTDSAKLHYASLLSPKGYIGIDHAVSEQLAFNARFWWEYKKGVATTKPLNFRREDVKAIYVVDSTNSVTMSWK